MYLILSYSLRLAEPTYYLISTRRKLNFTDPMFCLFPWEMIFDTKQHLRHMNSTAITRYVYFGIIIGILGD